ncbi:MAG: DUF3037 domain-containing protein [Nocardioidaceae bacterium]|nr:MAG: DUF3037 domain-containing protein [Nocardioidaceae bacterium]
MRADQLAYQYVVLRVVPRVDREEFINVGVVLYCQAADFLAAATEVAPERAAALAPGLDLVTVRDHLAAIEAVCRGEESAGQAATRPLGTRFGFLSAPRSTVVQPGPIHGGVSTDPEQQLEHLMDQLVRSPR